MKWKLVVLIVLLASMGCGKDEETVRVTVKTLTAAVHASGTLVPEKEYKVVSSVEGYLVRSIVSEGDQVQQGTLLFTLSSTVRNAQEEGSRALVNRTVPVVSGNAPALKELRNRIEVARIRAYQDSLQYVRYRHLLDQNAIARSTYERYYLQYQSAQKEYQGLRQAYRQQELEGSIQLQQAKNQLSVAAAQSDIGNIKSYVQGTVYEIYKNRGDLITPNQPIALIGTGRMIARLLIDEDDLNKVIVGQRVVITMDAFPSKVFSARVEKVYPLLNRMEQSFKADAVLDEPVPVEMYGLNLEANIVVAENKQVQVVPRSVLLKGDSIMIKDGRKTRKIKIIKGIEDDQWVEVKSGVNQKAVIIKAS